MVVYAILPLGVDGKTLASDDFKSSLADRYAGTRTTTDMWMPPQPALNRANAANFDTAGDDDDTDDERHALRFGHFRQVRPRLSTDHTAEAGPVCYDHATCHDWVIPEEDSM